MKFSSTPCSSLKNYLITLETQTSSRLWIWGKASTKLCSLRRIARKWHSMETTSCGNGLWCFLDWKMHLFFFNESQTKFSKRQIFLKCYIDDVLMHIKGFLQHLAHLKELFKRLHEINMKFHPKGVSLLSPH
jgi:hypothetical protein